MEVMILFKIKRKVPKAETKSNTVRITFPSEIRQILDIKDGEDSIYFEVNDKHEVMITKASD